MRKITLLLTLLLVGTAYASPEITEWTNDRTGDASLDINVTVGETVLFNVSANETVSWNWTLDGADQGINHSTWTYTFQTNATYYVGVYGSNENGSTQNVNWTVNAALSPPQITSWSNNRTGDASLNIGANIGDTVLFTASSSEPVNWNWTLNGKEQGVNQDAWTYTFTSYGTYYINISGSNANGNTQTVNWTVYVTLNFTDALGNSVSISEKPTRIVSLAPSNTEILFELGLGDSVVGVTSYCNYPPEAAGKTKVGGFYTPNVELVVNLTPDLILASDGNDITTVNILIARCVDLNCTVVGLKAETTEEIIDNINLVGQIADVNASGLSLQISQRISAIESNTSSLPEDQKLDTFYVVWASPLYTAGNGTFADDLIQKAGGKNIASNMTGWAVMNSESLLSRNPDVIICSGMGSPGTDVCSGIKNDNALSSLTAVANDTMYAIGDPNIIERPGPRIASGLETIHAILNFPEGDVNSISVQTTSPQSTSYEYGSTITLSYESDATIPIGFYRLDEGFITSFDSETMTISPDSGSHTITIWVRDTNGDWGSNTTSFAVNSPPQQSSGSGDSSSPSYKKPTVTTASGKADISIPSISKGSIVSIQIPDAPDVDITEISIKAKNSITSAEISIESLGSPPIDIPALGDGTYRYMEIEKKNLEEESIEELVIKFKVEREWLEDNDIDREDIKLRRYNSGQWTELSTSELKEDPTYIYYRANSPGFSYFAITGKKPALPSTTPASIETLPPLTESPPPATNPDNSPAILPNTPPPVETTDGDDISLWAVLASVVALPIILYVLLRRRKP